MKDEDPNTMVVKRYLARSEGDGGAFSLGGNVLISPFSFFHWLPELLFMHGEKIHSWAKLLLKTVKSLKIGIGWRRGSRDSSLLRDWLFCSQTDRKVSGTTRSQARGLRFLDSIALADAVWHFFSILFTHLPAHSPTLPPPSLHYGPRLCLSLTSLVLSAALEGNSDWLDLLVCRHIDHRCERGPTGTHPFSSLFSPPFSFSAPYPPVHGLVSAVFVLHHSPDPPPP